MNQTQKMQQQQTLSQKQIQSLMLLAMDTQELSEFIHQEYTDNPLIEIIPQKNDQTKDIGDYFNKSEYHTSNGIIHDEPPEISVLDDHVYSLQSHLLSQLSDSKKYSSIQWNLFNYIINSLDSSGFLTTPVQDLALHANTSVNQLLSCISILQSLEPAGVCATSVPEALIIQAQRKGLDNIYIQKLIKDYLPEIAAGQLNKISKELKISRKKLQYYINFIKTLDPKPCRHFGSWSPQYIIPDIIFLYEQNNWQIIINDDWFGSIGINKLYQKYSAHCTNTLISTYIQEKIQQALFIMNCIEQRRRTLINVSNYIIHTQQAFLLNTGPLHGISAKVAAKELNIHPSTISRAMHNKYIQTPIGTFLGKYFFKTGYKREKKIQPYNVSNQEILNSIKKIISSEKKNKPYTDSDLAKLLLKEDIQLSRRSITNFRKNYNIKNSYERLSD